ncbi:uncharacterized protein LOC117331772 [Pecten maximus]|uniref:uncharacterized protein LOC117331772 n=1 Tax=Pecten maximus TaxID=6579 RepID=UPI001457FD2C|nr:uncharacterized protein LOC117331772 [Pecten maximus]
MRTILLLSLLLWKVSPSSAGAYTYHSVYDYGLSTDQLSWIVVGSLIAFGIFLVVIILVCRQCGWCSSPHVQATGPESSHTRPLHTHVSVVDNQSIGSFQQVHQSPDASKLPGLPPYVRDYVPSDSIKSVPPPYTVEAEPW